ncbi:c-type cytochrome [Halopseudomonas phragmitis]|uniref:Cytochrome c5 family protein n=1 Tax=Pseudomonas jilinensis TaxID=2078689 RepID=A0A396RW54_9PSED|nr:MULTISPECIES: c-type cytochrome [Pseudomonadaceae]PAU86846.1 cytochrome C [Pseudomonas sp. WN033]RHW20659.1 cytochrome c5 family protein [Pseudomonas jilinensis]
MTTVKKLLAASAAMLALMAGSAFATAVEDAIAERIKPFGSVCLAGDPCAEETGAVAAASPAGGARSGEAVYKQFCTACHSTGLLGAPVTGDTPAWQARHGGNLDELLATAISGINAMPPKGTCADCSDDELMDAIKHMSGL